MDINKLSVRIKHDAHGPATKALSREGLNQLVDDAVHTLTVLNSDITPDSIREYVEMNIRINVYVGRYWAPSASDLEAALQQSRLEAKCAEHFGTEADTEDAPAYRR